MTETDKFGIYDEFPGYRIIEDDEREEALKDALVAVDANVLLDLYRYNQQTRNDLLSVLRQLGDRLWVPHQAMREFWRNRASVVSDRSGATKSAVAALEKQAKSAIDAIRTWQRSTAADSTTADGLVTEIETACANAVSTLQAEDPAKRESFKVATVDPVLQQLEELFNGRVGRSMDLARWDTEVAEGRRRAENKIPPGYRDAAKAESELPEGPSGDYLVWRQLLDEAKRRGKTTFLVTNDEKEDWWQKFRNERFGPRQELLVEFSDEVGLPFHMLTTADLLRAADALDVAVDTASIEDAERIERSAGATDPWTQESTIALIEGLDAEGAVQGDILVRAAGNGGSVSRAEVYEICNFPRGRSLRGFTRPVNRITRMLQDEGRINPDVAPALVAVYQGTPEAESFRIPHEMVSHILDNFALDTDTDESAVYAD